MGAGISDLAYAARSLIKAPSYSLVAAATLAVGIGANAAIFSVVNGVLLRPLPYADANELYAVLAAPEASFSASYPDLRDWQGRADLFEGLAGAIELTTDVRWDLDAEAVRGASITHNTLDVLGVDPILGRPFLPEEDRFGAADAVLLAEGAWERRYGRAPGVLGRTLVVGGEPHTIVGVLPGSFAFPHDRLELWTPLKTEERKPKSRHIQE